jgi:hypothetical protein
MTNRKEDDHLVSLKTSQDISKILKMLNDAKEIFK